MHKKLILTIFCIFTCLNLGYSQTRLMALPNPSANGNQQKIFYNWGPIVNETKAHGVLLICSPNGVLLYKEDLYKNNGFVHVPSFIYLHRCKYYYVTVYSTTAIFAKSIILFPDISYD